MMMLKSFSAIALAALPVQSANTWTLRKYKGWFGAKTIKCRMRDDLKDDRDAALVAAIGDKERLGWAIKLPTTTTIWNYESKISKHEPRFVCLGDDNQLFYYDSKGDEKAGGVKFTSGEVLWYSKRSLCSHVFAGNMGWKNANNEDAYISEYKIKEGYMKNNEPREKFYFIFKNQEDCEEFHKKLEAAAGITFEEKVEDESSEEKVDYIEEEEHVVEMLDGLVMHLNGDANEEQIQLLADAQLGSNSFLSACLLAGGIIRRNASGNYEKCPDVNADNMGGKIDKAYKKKHLAKNLKNYLGLAQRRRMATMERLVIQTEDTFSS